jgi:hypothetical protein
MKRPVFGQIAEELVPRQLGALVDDARQTPIADPHEPCLSRLAAKPEPKLCTVYLHVTIPQRGQPIGAVVPGVLFVSNPDARDLEKPHQRRDDLLPREAPPPHVPFAGPPDTRERLCEAEHPVELRRAADLEPA